MIECQGNVSARQRCQAACASMVDPEVLLLMFWQHPIKPWNRAGGEAPC